MEISQLKCKLYGITLVTATSRSGWLILPRSANGSGCPFVVMITVDCDVKIYLWCHTATYFRECCLNFQELVSKPHTVFRCVRKIAESSYYLCRLSVRPSVYPHGTTLLSLDGFSWNLTFVFFNTLKTGLLNCLDARSRGLTFRHRASCI